MTALTTTPSPILQLTAAAREHITRQILDTEGGIGFRLSVKVTGCSGLMYVPSIITQPPSSEDWQQPLITTAPTSTKTVKTARTTKTAKTGKVAIVEAHAPLLICVAKEAIPYVKGTVVDYQVSNALLGEQKMVFHNPQVKSLCGCGESFNIDEPVDEHDDE